MSFYSTCLAQVVGQKGATYSIAEQDAYEELMARIKSINWDKVFAKYKAKAEESTKVNFNLGKAREDRVFNIDPTYTLQFDIIDENGNIIYPKGFRFNPLDYISFNYQLVFFDGNSVKEIDWVKKQDWFNNWNVIFVITKGDVVRAERILGKSVFMATPQMIEKFKVSKTPSILNAEGKKLVIKEVGIYGKESKEKK